ncbi:hypothetical protein EON79_12370 [bacterium]|nr:MAG: hypothetical protein EON79_12370 [bacterium]
MTRRHPDIAIEWSPQTVDVYDGSVRHRAADLSAFRGKAALLALGRRSVFFRTTRLPNVAREAMRPILALKLGDLFPIPSSEIAFDYLLTEDVNESGRLVVVCAAPADTLRKAQEALRAAGIEPVRSVPVAFGSASLVAQGSAAVIEEAVEGYGIDIVEAGTVRYSRVVPLNSNVAAEACRTSTAAGLPCGDLVAAGGAVFPESDRNVPDSSLSSLLRHIPQLDLRLAEEVAKERGDRQRRQVRQAGLFLLASVVLAIFAFNDYDTAAGKAKSEIAQQTRFVTQAEKTRKEAEARAAELAKLQETLNKSFAPAQTPADIISAATALAPKGLWLGGFAVERGKAVQIRGTATRSAAVSEYVNALEDSPRFRNAKLQFSNDAEVAEKPVIQFSIEAFPVGNLPIAQTGVARTAAKK